MSNRRKARENADVWLVRNIGRVFFFDQSHTEVYENRSPPGLLSTFERKLLDACSYIWTESANIGTNLSVFQLCRPRIGFLFLKIFFRLFFPPRQVLLPKISRSVPILKVFTVHFSEIWNCFLRWGLLSVTLHNPSFLSCRPLLTNILDQWARENFYSYYKKVCKSRVNNANISANWCQVDTKNVENLTAAIPKSCYKITLGFIDFQHFFRG